MSEVDPAAVPSPASVPGPADEAPPEPGFAVMPQQSTFIGLIGPAWLRFDGTRATIFIKARSEHTNHNGTVHGGVLMTLMDITLGSTVRAALAQGAGGSMPGRPITMQITCSMIAPGWDGEWLRGEADVDRQARSVGFSSGRITAGDRLLMTGSALFKNPP